MKSISGSEIHRYHPSAQLPAGMGQGALIAGLRDGDEHCYVELIVVHGGTLLEIARRYLAEDEAHDAVQEAFLKAFEAIKRFREEANLATWLHRIVVNCCLVQLRTSCHHHDVTIDDLLPDFLPDGQRANPSPVWQLGVDELIEHHELQSLVGELIEQLPNIYRTVLLLRDVEGFSTAETAQLLGLSITAVKVRLHRARQAMRELLEPHVDAQSHVNQ